MITYDLVIANCISFIAAIFTARSGWVKGRRSIYMNQVGQCLCSAVASIFFHSYAGIVTLLVSAARNYLAATDRLDRRAAAVCVSLVVLLGAIFNNRGVIGWTMIAANVFYTLGTHLARRESHIKWNIIVNLSLWIIYEIFILDIPSLIADSIGVGTAAAALVRDRRRRD